MFLQSSLSAKQGRICVQQSFFLIYCKEYDF